MASRENAKAAEGCKIQKFNGPSGKNYESVKPREEPRGLKYLNLRESRPRFQAILTIKED